MMQEVGKAAVIHPTGTGKSFIAFHLALENPQKTICWLSPSEYIFKTQLENLAAANDGVLPQNIQFYTYAKLVLLTDSELVSIQPDYIILDEFHRCGAQVWGQGVQRLLQHYPAVPVLGLSATNIRYLDNQRDMADELFDGNVASYITLGEALVRGILHTPTYIQTVYSYQKSLEKLAGRVYHAKNRAIRDKAEILLESLRRALEMADGLDEVFHKHMPEKAGKYIVFCANKEHMDEMKEKAGEWFRLVDPQPHVYEAYSESPETERAFRDFKADDSEHPKLLYCIDMLNEGIHIDDVDGVILIRPTISPIVYKQQIGRALSASKRKQPVIFDIVNNFENLYSIGAIEDEMEEALRRYSHHEGEGLQLTEGFHIIDMVTDCRQLFQQLEDTLVASWEVMYDCAKKYYETHGNLEVPSRYRTEDGCWLGKWIQTQRRIRAGESYNTLTEERIQLLDDIGMVWTNIHDAAWEKALREAQAYYATHGHLNVPVDAITDSGFRLGEWIFKMRAYRNRGVYLTEERIKLLESMGMVWDAYDHLWQRNYQAARAYYLQNGHLNVPANYETEDGVMLGTWISKVRAVRQGKKPGAELTGEQIALLDSIGMQWSNRQDQCWEKAYAEAKAYYENHGKLKPPTDYKSNGIALKKWLDHQLSLQKSGKLSADRKQRLDDIGMIWASRYDQQWEEAYNLAKAYFAEHGNLKVPVNHKENGVNLETWLYSQRSAYKSGKLSIKRQRALQDIGMQFA